MTGRTHDLAAFTAMTALIATIPLSPMTLATVIVAFNANLLGALAPDIDQPTSEWWQHIRAGSFIGRIVKPFIGSHRFISHSLLGVFLASSFIKFLLDRMSGILLVDMQIVWAAFMIGYVSHLFMDMLTRDGVPLLFPLPYKIGIPPFRFLRMKTAGFMEKTFVFPALIMTNILVIYYNYPKFLDFFKHYLK